MDEEVSGKNRFRRVVVRLEATAEAVHQRPEDVGHPFLEGFVGVTWEA
jgi:hypothetical protein